LIHQGGRYRWLDNGESDVSKKVTDLETRSSSGVARKVAQLEREEGGLVEYETLTVGFRGGGGG